MRNGELWLPSYFDAILRQTFTGPLRLPRFQPSDGKRESFPGSLEVSLFDDGSSDGTPGLIEEGKTRLHQAGIPCVASASGQAEPRGVGAGKNAAVQLAPFRPLPKRLVTWKGGKAESRGLPLLPGCGRRDGAAPRGGPTQGGPGGRPNGTRRES